MRLKVCGIREHQNAIELAGLKPEWMGFIFYPHSSRYFLDAKQPVNIASIDSSIQKVGVFVDEEPEKLKDIQIRYSLDLIQLHGNESPDYCKNLKASGLNLIKAFPVKNESDLNGTDVYLPYIDYLLFDTMGPQPGGNGRHFDWALLSGKRFGKPFLLSGGISAEDVVRLKLFKHPDMAGIDINSRFESAPGEKDINRITIFLKELK